MNRTDVIIIGGGIAGLLSARELAEAGARVALLERQAIGKEASWAGGGILSPLYPWRVPDAITTLCRWSQAAYPKLAATLLESTGIDPEWLPSGLLYTDCEALDAATRWAQAHASRVECPAAGDMALFEPQLRAAAGTLLRFPDIGQIRNPRLLAALRQDLKQRGVELLEYHPVDEIKLAQGKVVGVACGQQLLSAEAYVVAAGAWTGLLARDSGLPEVSVVPVKGEMLIFDSPQGLLHHMVLSRGRYLIPRKDGKILAGSTVENAQFNKSCTDAARIALEDFAHSLLPPLRQCPVQKHWAGLRPGSPEGIPIIGAHPAIPNLYFNCGHFRNGFVMAPASARLLADHVLRRATIVAPEPYLPMAAPPSHLDRA